MHPYTLLGRALLLTALLGEMASAQESARSRLRSITSVPRRAGVYHVATGTWTHGADLSNLAGPDTIYNNTCAPGYFLTVVTGEAIQHRSRIPSRSGPTTPSVFYASTLCDPRRDEAPGCQDAYTVNGFEFAYCSSHVGTIDWQHQFAEGYQFCANADMVPQYTILVTGLPGGSSTGANVCWIVDVDLSGLPGGGILLAADGDGTYDGSSFGDLFGWSSGIASSSITQADYTGPIQAGDFTYTNGGTIDPCTGTDGTIWDRPIDLDEPGTGMASNNFFRVTGPAVPNPFCQSFGTIHSDFFLKLFAAPNCPPDDPLTKFCAPGVGGIVTCPCGNPQVPNGSTKGCNNFAGGGTGGAVLTANAAGASIANDTVAISLSAGVGNAVSVLFQGTTNVANARSGAGVRCVGGILKRLYKANLSAGAVCFMQSGVAAHDASAAKGFPIVPPVTLYYYAAYRNSAANGQPGCPGLTFGFNSTNALSLSWTP